MGIRRERGCEDGGKEKSERGSEKEKKKNRRKR